MSRCLHLIPIFLSLAACLVSCVSLFAGFQSGFMEEYAVIRVNTSMIGRNMINLPGNDNNSTGNRTRDGGLLNEIADKWDEITDKVTDAVEDGLNGVTNDIVDGLSDVLGVSEWYSLHILNYCQGNYSSQALVGNSNFNITGCSSPYPGQRFDLAEIIKHQLEAGPFNLTLFDINWPDNIEVGVETLNQVMLALSILYSLGGGLAFVSFLFCLVAFCVAGSLGVAAVSMVFSALAALSIMIASAISTIGAYKGMSKVNEFGSGVGVSGEVGLKFIILTWIPAALKLLTTLYWAIRFCSLRKERKKRQWRKWKEWTELEENTAHPDHKSEYRGDYHHSDQKGEYRGGMI